MFRLHIDIPLGENEQLSLQVAQEIINLIDVKSILELREATLGKDGVFQYRVSNDTDRAMRNYLIKNENRHVATKKIKITIEDVG